MLETVEQLKNERPDLVALFEKMSKEELLNQIYKEVLDGLNMEERVEIFMGECTDMSKTTYTPDAIKRLIQNKHESNISEFCKDLIEDIDGMRTNDIEEVKSYIIKYIID